MLRLSALGVRREHPRNIQRSRGLPRRENSATRLLVVSVLYGGSEFHRSLSKKTFAKSLSRLVPGIAESDLEPSRSGVRGQAIRRDGSLVEDFSFAEAHGCIFVLNAPSPAATAALSLGDYIARRIDSRLES